MKTFDTFLSWVVVAVTGAAVLGAPWMFAAWEFWWFWLLVVLIFLAAAVFALRMILCSTLGTGQLRFTRPVRTALLACLPFLVYALIRFLQARVYMDAEKSFLLFFTPWLLLLIVGAGFSRRQLAVMAWLLCADFLLLGGYGIVNHIFFHNARVLWMPGFPQYQLGHYRATGSYYCPDHFAGLMEIVLALGIAWLLTRDVRRGWRWAGAALTAVALAGILLSKSRGGALAVAVMLLVTAYICGLPYRPAVRWGLRLGVLALLAGAAGVLLFSNVGYAQRLRAYPWNRLQDSDRAIMIAGALRAWETAPVFGIGPGMHRNLWPHFAASADGDVAAGRWPSRLNTSFYSYEVHSDWVQLLEEYGVVGLLLFMAAVGYIFMLILRGWRQHGLIWRRGRETGRLDKTFLSPQSWALPAGLLALAALGFHSLGDFNLQMPATTWILATIAAIAVAAVPREA